MLLLWLAIMGAILASLGPAWALEGRRERERELVFRAEQIRQAITAYAEPINANGCSQVTQWPMRLEDLLDDRRCGLSRRHLRRLYADPITRTADWGLVKEFGGIRGVYSRSESQPVRRMDGVEHYWQWRFVVNLPLSQLPEPDRRAGGRL